MKLFVIFLAIENVLISLKIENLLSLQEIVFELHERQTISYKDIHQYIVDQKMFEIVPTLTLLHMIRMIEQAGYKAQIVIHDYIWKKGLSLEQIKDLFHSQEWARYIVDITLDQLPNDSLRIPCCAFSKHCDSCIACKINYWLMKHPFVNDYIVIDVHQHNHFYENFGMRYIQTQPSTLLHEKHLLLTQKLL